MQNILYKADNVNELFLSMVRDLKKQPELSNKTREIAHMTTVLYGSDRCFVNLPERKLNINYPLTEFIWYLTANRNVSEISEYAKIWDIIRDENGEVESNYGNYFFSPINLHTNQHTNQWDWCIDELSNDASSRRATLNILQPHHKIKNPKDIPCTFAVNFLIRNNQLNMYVYMRSCDIIFGWCNDIFCFSMIHQMMFNELKLLDKFKNLMMGSYTHTMTSAHIYERHYKYFDIFDNYDNSTGLVSINNSATYKQFLTIKKDSSKYVTLEELTDSFKDKFIRIEPL